VDAAVAAGVKRFIPSEYGTNNLDPRARAVVPIYDIKGNALQYLQKKAAESEGKFTWTSICCGSWLDWALRPDKSGTFLGIDVKGRKATVWDSGRARFAVTSSDNTGLAVVRALLPEHAEATANKQVFLADFMTDTLEIVEALEKETGEKWQLDRKESRDVLKAARARYDAGDVSAAFELLAITFVADVNVGYEFDKEQTIWNGRLGLPKETLDQVVKVAVEHAKKN
jgi:hypothetical protein